MLEKKVLEWLESTGFPLEMKVASAFREAGFDVRQSAIFSDPQSEKGREIDVLARDPDAIGIVDINFVIECKSSKNPWVVFSSDDALAFYNRARAFAMTSMRAREAMVEHARNAWWDAWVARSDKGGYGFRQALRKESDPAYAAAVGVVKACHAMVQEAEASSMPIMAFVLPIIVVDSPIYECSLDASGELRIVEVEKADFLFSAHVPESIGGCVRVVRSDSISEFAVWAKGLTDAIRMEFRVEEDKIFQSMIGKK